MNEAGRVVARLADLADPGAREFFVGKETGPSAAFSCRWLAV